MLTRMKSAAARRQEADQEQRVKQEPSEPGRTSGGARSLRKSAAAAKAKVKPLPPDLQVWVDVRKRYRLSPVHVQMARELGLNPRKFGKIANHRQEPWKAPLPQFIEHIYAKRFGRPRPEVVVSIEERARQAAAKKAVRKAARTARGGAPGGRANPSQHSYALRAARTSGAPTRPSKTRRKDSKGLRSDHGTSIRWVGRLDAPSSPRRMPSVSVVWHRTARHASTLSHQTGPPVPSRSRPLMSITKLWPE